jgi:hypothetical protein
MKHFAQPKVAMVQPMTKNKLVTVEGNFKQMEKAMTALSKMAKTAAKIPGIKTGNFAPKKFAEQIAHMAESLQHADHALSSESIQGVSQLVTAVANAGTATLEVNHHLPQVKMTISVRIGTVQLGRAIAGVNLGKGENKQFVAIASTQTKFN